MFKCMQMFNFYYTDYRLLTTVINTERNISISKFRWWFTALQQ